MEDKLDIEGLTIAPGVVETIIALAVGQVEGVALVGSSKLPGGALTVLGKKNSAPGILVLEDDGIITVEVHVQVYYGFRLPEIAANIRQAVYDALTGQVGIEVQVVNVVVDAIQFAE
ncbi:MAG: Asp23/Gls24 family envelope stress response protein [Coriobacteriales bacterium]|nr:Asp23/Gls24 family envelope stress response protein [Coriobacteriales bacterium]